MTAAAASSGGRIVALGGGGFSMEPDNPRLDRFVLSLARAARPRVLFVGTASGDAAEYRLRFYEAFARLDCRPAHLELFRFDRDLDLRGAVLASDIVYVGGGNTPAMLAAWRLYGLPDMLADALGAGAVLAGVSAGANCWFEQMVTDSVSGGGLFEGLGCARGTFCPHFDGEPWRRAFVERLAADASEHGFACDDSAAVVLDAAGDLIEAVCSVPGRCAYRWSDGRLDALPTRLLDDAEPAARATLPTLVGRRCTLRELTAADAPSIQRHADDEAVWRTLFDGFPRPYAMRHAEAWCGGQWREPQYGFVWAIDVGGEAIGCIGVAPQPGWLRCNAAVGYWIGRAFWRRGIGSDALSLVTGWAWDALREVTRLYAPIFATNPASQRLAAKCGYVREAELPVAAIKDGRVIDLVQYASYRPRG